MTSANKDTVYIDVDDEITAIIEKVRESEHKIVALVLPKRAAVLQSIVNMKLLKRAGDDVKKRVVLITSEAGLLPLAGVVGLYVAKTLSTKPAIPPAPQEAGDTVAADEASLAGDNSRQVDLNKSVGELSEADKEETIEVDNGDLAAASAAAGSTAASAGKKSGNKLKIPNFSKFRKRLIFGGLALLFLIIILVWAFVLAPRATVIVRTDTSSYTADIDFVADASVEEFNEENSVIPATVREFKQTESKTISATGEKDVGDKATGSVTLSTPCSANFPSIPSGTGMSTGNLTYISRQAVTLDDIDASGGNCRFTGEVNVQAQNSGTSHNISAGRDFSVSGHSTVSGVNDEAMSGGTTKVIKVVSQKDVDDAKNRIVNDSPDEARQRIVGELEEEGYISISDTFDTGETASTASPNVGDEADEVTVNVTVTYKMTGVKHDSLVKLIENDAKEQIDTEQQMLLDNGAENMAVRLLNRSGNGRLELNVQTVVVAGPNLHADDIKADAAGKNRGEAVRLIEGRTGVRETEIAFSPFWVYTVPKNVSKITVEFEGDVSSEQGDNNGEESNEE